MGRRRAAGSSSSSSFSNESSGHYHCTDLRLGLHSQYEGDEEEENDREESGSSNSSLFVKVYMEGIPIGRKLNLLANNGYHDLISTLHYMFNIHINSTILWSGYGDGNGQYDYVLTYQDKEGDWMMVGDVPWQMFLSTVQRLKITRPYFGS